MTIPKATHSWRLSLPATRTSRSIGSLAEPVIVCSSISNPKSQPSIKTWQRWIDLMRARAQQLLIGWIQLDTKQVGMKDKGQLSCSWRKSFRYTVMLYVELWNLADWETSRWLAPEEQSVENIRITLEAWPSVSVPLDRGQEANRRRRRWLDIARGWSRCTFLHRSPWIFTDLFVPQCMLLSSVRASRWWIKLTLMQRLFRPSKHGDGIIDTEVTYYSQKRISAAAKSLSVFIAVAILTVPVSVFLLVPLDRAWMSVTVLLSVLIFSTLLSLSTKIKAKDVLLGSAAWVNLQSVLRHCWFFHSYCAVLATFLGNLPTTGAPRLSSVPGQLNSSSISLGKPVWNNEWAMR